MKNTSAPVSVTSIPQAPRDENRARVRTYMITMGVRMLCFVLAVFVTPYGWYTLVFCAGAIFLPYIAVVLANSDGQPSGTPAETPALALPSAESSPADAPEAPTIIRISETSSPGDDSST